MITKKHDKMVAKHAILMTIALQGIRDLCDLHEDTPQSVGDAKEAMRYINKIVKDVLARTDQDIVNLFKDEQP